MVSVSVAYALVEVVNVSWYEPRLLEVGNHEYAANPWLILPQPVGQQQTVLRHI